MLPLIVAVTYAVWEMSSQARAQQRLVMQQAQISHLSVSVQELSKEIERAARQFQLLQESSFLEILNIKQSQLEESIKNIKLQLPEFKNNKTIKTISETSSEIGNAAKNAEGDHATRLESLYKELKDNSAMLSEQLTTAIQSALSNSEKELNNVLWRVLVTGLLALPASLFLLGASSMIVNSSSWTAQVGYKNSY